MRSSKTARATCVSRAMCWETRAPACSKEQNWTCCVPITPTYPHAARLFRRPAFRLVQARRRVRLRLGHGAGHAAGPERRLVGGYRGRALPLSGGRQTSRSSRRPGRLLCTRRSTGWPLCRCSGCSKTRAATSGSQPSSPNTNGLARWERVSEQMRDLARSPGLPSLKDDLPRSFGEDGSGNVWIGFNRGLARYAQGTFHVLHRNRGTAARRDREHPRGPLGPALARVRARRARSRRRPRGGATDLRHLHDRAGAVEQQHRSDHRRRRRAHLRRWRARTRPARSADRPRQAFHHRRRPGAGLVSSRLPRPHWRALVRHDLAAWPGSRPCARSPRRRHRC